MCIINNTYRFVFVHIPKCAGTSVTASLSELTTFADLEIGGTEFGEKLVQIYAPRFGIFKHSRAIELKNILGRQQWKQYFTFTFVRNPYDRAVSTFFYLKKHEKSYPFMREFSDVDAFIRSAAWDARGPDRLLERQVFWTRKSVASDHCELDFVGRVETLEEDLARVLGAVAASPIRKTPLIETRNRSEQRPVRIRLSEQAIERVRQRYAPDFEAFGYDPDHVPAFLMANGRTSAHAAGG